MLIHSVVPFVDTKICSYHERVPIFIWYSKTFHLLEN